MKNVPYISIFEYFQLGFIMLKLYKLARSGNLKTLILL